MWKSGTFGAACLALVFGACSSSKGADGQGGVGASASIGGDGQTGQGGGGASTSDLGGTGQTDVGGTGQDVGGTATTAGGNSAQGGGVSALGGAPPGLGGATACGQSVCGPDMCGSVVDACSVSQDCGKCPAGSICGLTTQNLCTACTVTTCADKGANCGYMSDGCNGLVYCGDCGAGQECGVDTDNVCGDPQQGGGTGGPCADPNAGFCPQVVDCTGSTPTTLTGTVLAPNGTMPLPNAIIYVPNGSTTYPYGVTEFVDGVANNTACSCDTSGSPLVSTTSAADGSFTLSGVPVGANIPLVIQLGRWRRVITVPNVAQCATTAVATTLTSLPSRQDMGSSLDAIPFMALSTGSVDAIECVIRKMGVEDSQFSNGEDSGGGRIRFYRQTNPSTSGSNQGNPGASCTTGGSCVGTTPPMSTLLANQASVDRYDALLFPCKGGAHDESSQAKTLVLADATNANAYVNKGGRAFFTHYSYGWLYNQSPAINLPWISTASVGAEDGAHHDPTQQVEIDTTFARGAIFAQWLGLPSVNALSGTNPPRIGIDESRENVRNPANWNNTLVPIPALRWAFYSNNNPAAMIQHITFDTPWGLPPDQQCGRVLYSSFHVTTAAIAGNACTGGGNNASTQNCNFPQECNTAFTPQEKALAYFMFDMTSCVKPPDKHCKPKTCADVGKTCGLAADGCGGPLDCGPCCTPVTCDQICADPNEACSATYDPAVWALTCAKPNRCNGTVDCYCKIG